MTVISVRNFLILLMVFIKRYRAYYFKSRIILTILRGLEVLVNRIAFIDA